MQHSKHPSDINSLFNRIAPKYDGLNHLLSLGIDRIWRRKLVRALTPRTRDEVADIASGTGDMLLLFCRTQSGRIIGIDPSENMLARAKSKLNKKGCSRCHLIQASGESIPLASNSVDRISIVFGIRNFSDLNTAFNEVFRILRPGGRLGILEFSLPRNHLVRFLYRFYLKHFIPVIGGVISGEYRAYKYLADSVIAFTKEVKPIEMMEQTGFIKIEKRPLSFGIISMYIVEKQ